MQIKRATLILLLVLMPVGGRLNATLAQQNAASNLTIEVKSAAGRIIKHVCVTYIPKNGEVQFRNTDARGRVEFRNLAPGEGRVVVKADGYTAQKKSVTINGTSATDVMAFSLAARE
jgi:hypothetical protein